MRERSNQREYFRERSSSVGSELYTSEEVNAERKFLEELIDRRLNLLFVIVGTTIAGILASKSATQIALIFYPASPIGLLVGLSIIRAQSKQDIVFKILREQRFNIVALVDFRCDQYSIVDPGRHRIQQWIAYGVPTLFFGLCLLGTFKSESIYRYKSKGESSERATLNQVIEKLDSVKYDIVFIKEKGATIIFEK